MWALSLTLIVLSMRQVKLFSGKIDMYDMFGFDSLTWEIKRIEAIGIDKEQEYINATNFMAFCKYGNYFTCGNARS